MYQLRRYRYKDPTKSRRGQSGRGVGHQCFLKEKQYIVGNQLQNQVRPIREEVTCRDLVDSEAVFSLFDQILRVAPMVIEPVDIQRRPIEVGDIRRVTISPFVPKGALRAFVGDSTHDDNSPSPAPTASLIPERRDLRLPLFIRDPFPFLLGNLQDRRSQSGHAAHLNNVSGFFFFKSFHDLVAVEALIKPGQSFAGGIHRQRFLDKGHGVGHGSRIAGAQRGIERKSRRPLERQQWMIAGSAVLVWIVSDGTVFLVAVYSLDRGIEIKNQTLCSFESVLNNMPVNAQQLPNFCLRIESFQILVEQGVVGQTRQAKFVSNERVLLDGLEMLRPLQSAGVSLYHHFDHRRQWIISPRCFLNLNTPGHDFRELDGVHEISK